MTISFLSGGRIQGLSTDITTVYTTTDSFGSGFADRGWLSRGSQVEITGGVVDVDYGATDDNSAVYKSLGYTIDGDFTLKFKQDWISYTSSTSGMVGLADSSGVILNTAASGLNGIAVAINNDSSGNHSLTLFTVENGVETNHGDAPISTGKTATLTTDPSYVKLTRVGNLCTISVYSTDAYSGTPQTAYGSVSSSFPSLNTIQMGMVWTMSGRAGHYKYDDLDLTSSVTTKPSDVPDYSRFEETDTRKIYTKLPYFTATTGLKAYWKFNESSGKIINQATAVGSSNAIANTDLTVTGATYGATGLIDDALSFDGVNDKVDAVDSVVADWNFINQTGASWSIIFWFKFDNFTTRFWHGATSNGNGGDTGFNIIGSPTASDRKLDVSVFSAGSDDFFYTTTQTFDNNTSAFQFVAITYNDATGDLKIKINGNSTETFGGNDLTNTNTAEQKYHIGENSDGVFDTAGDYDEYSIWNRVLTEAELVSLYNSGNGKAISSTSWKEKGQN